MQVITAFDQLKSDTPLVLAFGFFDGVHPGHRAVLKKVCDIAKEENLIPAAFTFDLGKASAPKPDFSLLTTKEEQEALLAEIGIARLYRPAFSEISHLTPEETVLGLLARDLKARFVVAGPELRFGRGAAGNLSLLQNLGLNCDISACSLPPVFYDNAPISSTRIRQALRAGKAEEAASLMGRPFSFTASVIEGAKIGRTMGFPTINQAIPEDLTLPLFGVYATSVTMDDVCYAGITNIGVKPTVGGTTPLAETHLLQVDGNFYGKSAKLELLSFLRPEKRFDSLADLQAQIGEDMAAAAAYFAAQKLF